MCTCLRRIRIGFQLAGCYNLRASGHNVRAIFFYFGTHIPFCNSLNLNSSLAQIIHQYLFTPFCRSPLPTTVYSSLNSVEYSYQKYPSPPLHHQPHVQSNSFKNYKHSCNFLARMVQYYFKINRQCFKTRYIKRTVGLWIQCVALWRFYIDFHINCYFVRHHIFAIQLESN